MNRRIFIPCAIMVIVFHLQSLRSLSEVRNIEFASLIVWSESLTANSTSTTHSNPNTQRRLASCFSLNSQEWLQGQRHGNLRDPSLFDMNDILPPLSLHDSSHRHLFMQNLLDQSMCADTSSFRNLRADSPMTRPVTDATLKAWTTRLIYWSLHYHQTRHARPEAKHRLQQQLNGVECYSPSSDIGPYDYECPDAKFLIVSLTGIGLGANVRSGMVYSYLAGLISDRVVLFVNHSPGGPGLLTSPWPLVSCEDDKTLNNYSFFGQVPRNIQDAQCFFAPSSPCVLTLDAIMNAYRLNDGARIALMNDGRMPAGHEHDKVWHFDLSFTPMVTIPKQAMERLYNYSHHLIQEYLLPPSGPAASDYQKALYRAANNILEKDKPRSGYNFACSNLKVHHALVVYSLRPRHDKARQMKAYVDDLKTRYSIYPEVSFGLPIRGKFSLT
jgi:hypothetical protein